MTMSCIVAAILR